MAKIKNEMATRCELAMMGKVVPVNSNDEVQALTEYITTVINGEEYTKNLVDILKNAICKYHQNKVKYLVVNKIMGMPCITYLLDSGVAKDDEEYYPAPFEEDYGTGCPCAFCYVFNLESDWCSEFGDVFFTKKRDGFYHRAS